MMKLGSWAVAAMHHESDISWHLLRRIARDWIGESAELAEVKPLDGGVISTTLLLTLRGGEKAVLKISPHRVDRRYEEEAHQLELLRGAGLPAPCVHLSRVGDLDNPFSYNLIEYIEGVDFAGAKDRCTADQFDELQTHLAELVLRMHGQTADFYGRIVRSQPRRYGSWPEFYRSVYDDIWRETEKFKKLPLRCRKQISRIHERLDRLIAHDDCPRLVHWDIWTSNLLARPDDSGRWRVAGLLDPNCKYAHAEAEIAYMELFRTITPIFLRVYQQDRRLDEQYMRVRRDIYQMYELINHVQLFGEEYIKPLMGTVQRLGAVA